MADQPYILGLDIGSDSLGWAAIKHPLVSYENNIIAAGVRIFPAGTNNLKPGNETSKCGDRRGARGMRRQLDRRSRRKKRLLYVLRKHGILSLDRLQLEDAYKTDPYELRAQAVEHDLNPNDFSRALIHLNQKRGFKSNRRSGNSDSKVVGKGISEFKDRIKNCDCPDSHKCQTVGQYLYRHVPLNSAHRRNRKSNSPFYFDRAMVRDEFDQIWQRQKKAHPDLLSDEAYNDVAESIFWQRPFDQVSENQVGRCSLEKREPRARLGHRLAQRYRILTEIDNIRIEPTGLFGRKNGGRRLDAVERRTLSDYLETKDKLKIAKIPDLLGISDIEINLARGEREHLNGNQTEKTLRTAFGTDWVGFSEEKKNAICHFLLEEDEDDAVRRKAMEEWNLSEEAAEALIQNPFKAKHGSLSIKAIQTLLPDLEAGLELTDAIRKHYPEPEIQDEPYPLLPFPPGTCFHSEHSKKKRTQKEETRVRAGAESARENRLLLSEDYQAITNPVVRKALFEVRKVVNALIRKYGKPQYIRVELARETKGSIDERNERAKDNAKRRREKEFLIKEIKEILSTHCGTHREPTGGDILKYRLYKECGGVSAYSGKAISRGDLFSGSVHVDHIIPFSRSLDDSSANKVLCFHDENADKGNQTPFEWMQHNTEKYHEMIERAKRFNCADRRTWLGKLRRFEQETVGELDDFIARKLTDTQYIARQVHDYLQCLYPTVKGGKRHVQVGRGQTTATLRHLWGLDGILWELNEIPYDEQSVEKNRDDHRHHAIDAIVVALTSAATLQQFSRRLDYRGKNNGSTRTEYPTPWANQPEFRNHIKAAISEIVVSHAPTRRVRGPLHQETMYGNARKDGAFTIYKPVLSLTKGQIEGIADDRIRRLILGIITDAGFDWEAASDRDIQKALKEHEHEVCFPMKDASGKKPCPIRRVKILVNANKTIPVTRSNDTEAYVTPGSNHHVEIFEWEEQGKLIRDVVLVSRYEAANRLRSRRPLIAGLHPTANARFLMSLCRNDIVELRYRGGPAELCVVQKLTVREGTRRNVPDIYFRLLNSASADDKSAQRRVTNLDPKEFEAVKVEVTPIGLQSGKDDDTSAESVELCPAEP